MAMLAFVVKSSSKSYKWEYYKSQMKGTFYQNSKMTAWIESFPYHPVQATFSVF